MIKKLKQIKYYKAIKESGLFDAKYYLFTYPDVRQKGINPIKHYIRFGADEGRNPSAEFDTNFYLESYSDVKESGVNPLAHYVLYGKDEGRQTMIKKTLKSIQDDGLQKTLLKVKNKLSETKEINAEDSCFDFQFSQNNSKSNEYIDYEKKEKIQTDIRLIAFYLPQFHPIPQNDEAWGKGFTEWTNVSKAIPQFEGHYQPRLPGELGYYDLRLLDIQKRQIELAKNYGLHGFCYHYYWFDGKKVMDTPLQQVLDNKDLDFPFCINWANENWTKRWDGLDNEVILKQNHSAEDDLAFLEAIKPILMDNRYIKVNGKALLMIYRPQLFPDIQATVKRWRKHAKKIGIGELYLVLSHAFDNIDPLSIGFDAATEFAPNNFQVKNLNSQIKTYNTSYKGNVYDYKSAINYSISMPKTSYTKFRSICPSWDNEARKPGKGTSFINTSPSTYSKWLEYVLYNTNNNQTDSEKIVFINAWNEWAEGAYLEPDRKYGYAYLDATYKQIEKFDSKRLKILKNTQKSSKNADTAVILHLFYVDLWNEIKEELQNFKEPIDLYISINNNASLDTIKKIIKDYPTARIYSFENRGRDIYPFIQTMKTIAPLKYTYVCKIHTKKSLHRNDGDKWRNHLIQSLIGSEERISDAKKYIDNGAGIVVAKGNVFDYHEWIGTNKKMVEEFSRKAKIVIPDNFNFPAGSMFWFNPVIMDQLIQHFDDSILPFEEGQIDGTMAHAIERIFGLLCSNNNYLIKEI
jgi:lipopolysaccharide biosynthesis protein